MSLSEYRKKRNFKISSEPAGKTRETAATKQPLLYVIQKHRATQLHYDFRLEFNGVLLSWAVPKGPSPDPSVKRLAMQVEDHPREYASFEGVIPEGEYGGGTVMVWDAGEWSPESENVEEALRRGDLKFTLNGKKLHGSWVLVRTRGFSSKADKSWLLIKHRDRYAEAKDLTLEKPRSVLSGMLLAEIAAKNGGDVERAATGDPGRAKKASKRIAPKPTQSGKRKSR
jgi:bifunctional non-homologous end joining protein LigD